VIFDNFTIGMLTDLKTPDNHTFVKRKK